MAISGEIVGVLVEAIAALNVRVDDVASKQLIQNAITEANGLTDQKIDFIIDSQIKSAAENWLRENFEQPKDGVDGIDGKDGRDGRTPTNAEIQIAVDVWFELNREALLAQAGIDGKDGKDGVDGKDGKNGTNGKDGRNGANGTDGVGIALIEQRDDRSFYITLTNGEEFQIELPSPKVSGFFGGNGGGGEGSGTVTSVSGTGTVSGLTLIGTVTTSGSLVLGGELTLTSANVTDGLGYTPYNATNPAGYTTNVGTVTSVSGTGTVSGLTLTGSVTSSGSLTLGGTLALISSDVTSALGFTPYDASNPAGYTDNTGTVTSIDLTAGTGISVSGGPITSSGSITVENTAPDQIVSLTAGSNVTITGTYPNFTIAASGGGGGGGTVTSVAASGGTTGLSFDGSPITTSGTLTLTGTLAVGSGGTGATSLTGVLIGNGTSAFTTVTAPSGAIVGTSDTQTLTNKRITARISSAASAVTLAWNSDNFEQYALTAQASALAISADAGAPTDGQRIIFRIKDDGTPRAITWASGTAKSFQAIGVVLPTTTVASKTIYVGCIYNSASSRWDAIAVAQEA